jgi:para-nitrobenzyl esterase
MHSVVKTTAGEVRGEVTGGVARYLGIPYAAAPFGEHRFRAPAPPPSWDGVRDALEHGPTAPAPGYPAPFTDLLPARHIPGEEILNLSVWAPEGAAAAPVMVWLHGGAFVNGSSSLPTYDGGAFARDGVVLVGVNYRLGIEGFLHVEGSDPNRGLLDQVAALAWVRDNVAAFGGDGGNVTVFGESAGAMCIGALLAMPAARGLFHRAILQSGGGHHAIGAATASRVAGYAAQRLGVEATAEALGAFSGGQLLEVQKALSADAATAPDPARWGEIAANGMVFEPVVDGDVLPQLPIEAVAAGAGAGVEIMVGSNRDEHRLFLVPPGTDRNATEPMLAAVAAAYRLPDGALDRYRAASPDASPGMVLADVMSDWFFRIPAVRLAEARGAHVYEFDWASSLLDGRLGACHALELGFVFDTLASARGLTGPDAPQELADAMHRAWVAFATDGDPGWEPYGETRAVRRFGTTVETVTDPRGDIRGMWEGIR